MVTTTAVMCECGNALARTHLRTKVVRAREELLAAGDLIDPLDADVSIAWAEYALGTAGAAGITDQVSFAVMRRLGISKAFTNDRHFRAAGFELLF
jgi:predicted nucleic acid-binding protein